MRAESRRPAPRRAHDPLDAVVALACWACVAAGAGFAFLGAGLAQGGDRALGGTLALAGLAVCCGGAGGAVVMHGGRRRG